MALLPSRCAAHPPACPCHSRALMPPFLSRFADLVRAMSNNTDKLNRREKRRSSSRALVNVGDGQDHFPQHDPGHSLIPMQRAGLWTFSLVLSPVSSPVVVGPKGSKRRVPTFAGMVRWPWTRARRTGRRTLALHCSKNNANPLAQW